MSLKFFRGPEAEEASWYVRFSEGAEGPFTKRDLQHFYRSQTIDALTPVWPSGGWRPFAFFSGGLLAVDLELPIADRRAPPAACAWMVACTPALGIGAAILFRLHLRSWGAALVGLAAVLQIVLAEVDLYLLQRAGIDTSRMGPPAAVPLYLNLRAQTLREAPRHRAVWWAAVSSAVWAMAMSVEA